MIELGKMQTLTVLRIKDFGVYLGHEGEKESVLLPRKQVPQGTKEGDEIYNKKTTSCNGRDGSADC